jgi:hypothetical protein
MRTLDPPLLVDDRSSAVDADKKPASDRRCDAIAFAVLSLVGAVVPFLIAWQSGALGIPRYGDDWSYLLTLFRFADHGELNGNHWVSMNLVGQIVAGAVPVKIFGAHIEVAQLETLFVGLLGLGAVYDLGKRMCTRQQALFVAALVAVGPMWATFAVSFMTDVWSFSFIVLCLALGARAMEADRTRLGVLVGSIAVGVFAFTIREYAVVAPLAVVLVAMWREPQRMRRTGTCLVGTVLVSAAAFELWRHTLSAWEPSLSPGAPSLDSVDTATNIARELMMSVGLVVSPAVVLAGPVAAVRRAWRSSRRLTVLVAGSTAFLLGWEIQRVRHSEGYFWVPVLAPLRQGVDGPALLPRTLTFALAVLGAASMTVLLLMAVPAVASLRRRRLREIRPARPAVAVVAGTAVALSTLYVVALVTEIAVWDRYVLPLVPLVALLALSSGRRTETGRWRMLAAGAVFGAVALFGALYVLRSASFEATAWHVAERASMFTHDPTRVSIYSQPDWMFFQMGDLKVGAACVDVEVESMPLATDRPVIAAGEVWAPWGTRTWLVARQTGAC